MQRLLFSCIGALLTLFIWYCREDNPRQKEGVLPEGAIEQYVSDTLKDSLRLDSLFDRVLQCENAVTADSSNSPLRKKLLQAGFDTVANCFFVVGKGTIDTALPENARPLSQKVSAKYAAEKWALYCKNWVSGGAMPYGARVSGKILYAKNLRARTINDTLLLLYMVPAGSVVVK